MVPSRACAVAVSREVTAIQIYTVSREPRLLKYFRRGLVTPRTPQLSKTRDNEWHITWSPLNMDRAPFRYAVSNLYGKRFPFLIPPSPLV